MYGSEFWYVGDKCVNKFCTAWRNGLRRIWNLPYDAQCDIVTVLSDGMSILDESCKHSLNFVAAKCLCHSSGQFCFIMSHVEILLLECHCWVRTLHSALLEPSDFISGVATVKTAMPQCYE